MSVMGNTVKTKFAGLLRGLLRRFEDEAPAAETIRPVTAAAPVPPIVNPPPVFTQPPPPPAPSRPPMPDRLDEIQLPLQPIIASLPMELRAKVVSTNIIGMTIGIPVEKAISQLATGSVKITFGELRQLVPGLFANSGGELDHKQIALPLNEILSQINPALLARRATQKKVQVGAEILSPFDASGQGLKISPPQSSPASLPPRSAPVFVTPVQAPPAATPSIAFTPRWTTPAPAPAAAPQPNGVNGGNGLNGLNNTHTPPAAPIISAAPVPPIAPPAIPPAAALPDLTQPTILASLAALAEAWPESLRLEISQSGLANSQVALPINLVEPALKRGRVIFSWRFLRSCIAPVPPAVSVHDAIELELPLKVIAPLFLSRSNGSAKSQKSVAVSKEIPNLFFGFPQPAAEPPASAPIPFTVQPSGLPQPASVPQTPPPVAAGAPPDTNFFTRPGEKQITDTEFKSKAASGTDFVSRFSPPGDIVKRAANLEGVVGALVALPDGLMVASQIPTEFNADTLAAFLPQIYGRVTQCSKELRMGELNNLSFTVGNVPWKIFRVNAVYFAAFGRAGHSLPAAPLAALAAELDRKNK